MNDFIVLLEENEEVLVQVEEKGVEELGKFKDWERVRPEKEKVWLQCQAMVTQILQVNERGQ